MIRIPAHHVIVPRTYELSYFIPKKNTNPALTRNADVQTTTLFNQSILPLSFKPLVHKWVEIYLNGNRIINSKYPTANTSGIPNEEYNFLPDGTVVFSQPIFGDVTVISDREIEPLAEKIKEGLIIDIENVQSWNYYQQKFNPARWASGNTSNKFSGNVVNPYKLINTEIFYRVGDPIYAEPVIIKQPLNGYARLTKNRENILYVPNKDFIGDDVFSYTIMTVHGQIGIPECVHIRVVNESPLWQLNASPNLSIEGNTITFTLTATRPVGDGINVAYSITGSGITTSDFGGQLLTGNFITQNNSATVLYNTVDDKSIEAPIEKLTMTLVKFPSVTANAYIQDTPRPTTTTTTTTITPIIVTTTTTIPGVTTTTTTTTTLSPRPTVVLSGTCINISNSTTRSRLTATFSEDVNPWNFSWTTSGLNVMTITGGPRSFVIEVTRVFWESSGRPNYTLFIPQNVAYSKVGSRGNLQSNTVIIPAC